jgi:hypothetical protein
MLSFGPQVTTAHDALGVGALTVMFGRQVAVGAIRFQTVTSKLQVVAPFEQLTVVMPMGKDEPEAGLQVPGPHPPGVVGGG